MALHFIQVEREFLEGPAVSEASLALGVSEEEVIGRVVLAWAWSLDNAAPEGVVAGSAAVRTVERAARWNGERGAFVAALPAVFEVTEEAVRFSGWPERYGKYLTAQERDAERKRLKRMSKQTSAGRPPDVPKTSAGPAVGHPGESLSLLSSRSVSGGAGVVDASHREQEPGALRDAMDATFKRRRRRPYRWSFEDERKFGELMDQPVPEILRRWDLALRRTVFPICTCVADLAKHWNAYGAEEPKKSLLRETSDEDFREQAKALEKDEQGDFILPGARE